MSTAVVAVLYGVVLATAFMCAPARGRDAPTAARRPVATSVALLVVGVPSVLQLTVASWLLGDLERDWAAIDRGQVWRLLTSLVVQDGGLPGAVFNLVFLVVIGVPAEAALGSRRWGMIAVGAGVGAQFWGAVVQPTGAGNSVAVFGLAASLAVLALHRGTTAQRRLGVISLLAAACLLIVGDIHGGAAAIGGGLAASLLRTLPRGSVKTRHDV